MVDYYKNAPRLRNLRVMPGQMAVKFAKLDYGFYEACLRVERQGPHAAMGSPGKLLEEDRMLSLIEIRKWCEGVLRRHNVPEAQWVDGECGGR